MSRHERKLEKKGYRFTGDYASGPDGKIAMKAKASEFRSKGYFATVVHRIYHGRVTSSDGYSVYTKARNPACQGKPTRTLPGH